MDIQMLKREGHSIREISRLTGHSRNTIRKVLREKIPSGFKTPDRKSKLDAFKEYIKDRYAECSLSSVRMLEEIKPMGYNGSLRSLQEYMQTFRKRRRALEKMTVRFETPPGKQAQADWTYCGRHKNSEGKKIPVYGFSMVLGYSRAMFVTFTTSMKLPILLRCHQMAFEYFGGWPEEILYDNMAQIRLPNTREFNPLALDFSLHYDFTLKTHRAYRARTKGKVERGMDYVKDNFLNGRSFADIDDLNSRSMHWLSHVANIRIHGTTNRRPFDMLKEETLTAITEQSAFVIPSDEYRKVGSDGLVRFKSSCYSVAPEHVGKSVNIEHDEQTIVIRSNNLVIAEHPLSQKRGSTIVQKEHIAQMWKQSVQTPTSNIPKWELTFSDEVQRVDLAKFEGALV